jgi:hypothetical protein
MPISVWQVYRRCPSYDWTHVDEPIWAKSKAYRRYFAPTYPVLLPRTPVEPSSFRKGSLIFAFLVGMMPRTTIFTPAAHTRRSGADDAFHAGNAGMSDRGARDSRRRDRLRRLGCPKPRLRHRIGLRISAVCIVRLGNARHPAGFHTFVFGPKASLARHPFQFGRRPGSAPFDAWACGADETWQPGAEPLVGRAMFQKMDYYPWEPCRSCANFDAAGVAYPGRANERDRLRGALAFPVARSSARIESRRGSRASSGQTGATRLSDWEIEA